MVWKLCAESRSAFGLLSHLRGADVAVKQTASFVSEFNLGMKSRSTALTIILMHSIEKSLYTRWQSFSSSVTGGQCGFRFRNTCAEKFDMNLLLRERSVQRRKLVS